MAAESQLTPTEYIGHHLTNFTSQTGQGSFWTLHVDTLIMALVVGFVGVGFFWWVARGATAGVPSRKQAFVEMVFDFVDEQVKGIFHGNRHQFIAPAALTVFVWVLLMNALDFLPVDITAWFYEHVLHLHNWRNVPTAWRRVCSVFLLARVTMLSAMLRAALAFASVVVMRRALIRLQTRLDSSASRCADVRPSLIVFFRCLMKRLLPCA